MGSSFKPDEGYAWMVVIACFSINFIMGGLARAAGVLYLSLITTFSASREAAAAPFSIRFCVRNMCGPIVGLLGQYFGIRPVVFLGGLIAAVGGILCTFASDITMITVSWGLIHGIGYGLSNLIHVLLINQYFDKYKGIAMGIACAGDCVGTVILPVLLEWLAENYDLRGIFLILGGICLHILPAAMLLRSPPWITSPKAATVSNKQQIANEKMLGVVNRSFVYSCEDLVITETPEESKSGKENPTIIVTESELSTNLDPVFAVSVDSHLSAEIPSIYHIPGDEYYINIARDCGRLSVPYHPKNFYSLKALNKQASNKQAMSNLFFQEKNRKNSQISVSSCPPFNHSKRINKFRDSQIKQEMLFDPFINGNETKITHKCTLNNGEVYPSVGANHDKNHDKLNNDKNREAVLHEDLNCKNELMYSSVVPGTVLNNQLLPVPRAAPSEVQTDSTNSVFKQFLITNIKPIFLLISATMALYVFLFIAVFTVIIDYASDNGIPTEIGKYLIISFSVTDLIGRIGFGAVLDKGWIPLKYYAGLTTGIMGLTIFLIPIYVNFYSMLMLFTVCGLIQGGTAIMYPLLVSTYMEKKEESIALGCLNFYGGVLMLPIPAMIGFFRDSIGSYDGVFLTTGGLCIFAGMLWLFEPVFLKIGKSCTNPSSNNC